VKGQPAIDFPAGGGILWDIFSLEDFSSWISSLHGEKPIFLKKFFSLIFQPVWRKIFFLNKKYLSP